MRAPHPTLQALVFLLCCQACSGAGTESGDGTTSTGSESVAPVDPRSFARGATFETLVVRAHALLLSPEQAASDDGCVLSAKDDRVWVGAELLAAVDPLPDATPDLAARVQRSLRPVRVLTAWGETHTEQADIALAAFTALDAASRRLPFVVAFVTSSGTHLRYGNRFADAQDGPLDASALQVRLDTLSRQAPYVLYVTADASVPLTTLFETMAGLADTQPTALAVALPEATALPTPPPPPDASRLECAGGLPEPAADATEGELAAAEIMKAIEPLKAAAQRCLEQASGPAAAGGRIVLAMRVEPTGTPAQLCLVEDGIRDPVLASCIVESARTLRLPQPQPAGFVDVHVPLQLSPISRPPPRPVCR